MNRRKSVPLVGLELDSLSTLSEKDLRQSPQAGAAYSGAVSADALLAMLATLSPEDRERLRTLLNGSNPPA